MTFRIRDFQTYENQYKKSVEDPESFWAEMAETFQWRKKWDKVLEWNFKEPDVNWFLNGKLNITENCLDRHLETRGDQLALIWEPNDPKDGHRTFTYNELHKEVCRAANMLLAQGIKKGDRVCLYMPMIPELAISVLACARIGAIHSVVFAGFSARSLADRIIDGRCHTVITCDELVRGDKKLLLKHIVDEALVDCPMVERTIVYKHTGVRCDMTAKDVWWHEAIEGMSSEHEAETMDSEDTLWNIIHHGSNIPSFIFHYLFNILNMIFKLLVQTVNFSIRTSSIVVNPIAKGQ